VAATDPRARAASARGGALRTALVSACGLLGVAGTQARATEVSSAVLGYTEPNRVSAFEAVTDVNHVLADGKVLHGRLVYDALSGASANGGVPASFAQTFTSPSGRASYTTPAGETPLDNTFHDARVAVSGGISLPWGRLTTVSAGLYGSGEHDYTSLGANLSLARDFNRRNTTVALRAARFEDTINPEGGRPVPLASMSPAGTAQPRLAGDGSKSVTDLGVGLTQVLGRRTLLHLNYTHSDVRDYQTDPYKLVSVVDAAGGDPVDALYEKRPDARAKNVLFGELNRSVGGDVVSLGYRWFQDDWGVRSHTVDLTYRWNFAEGRYLMPHGRWYTQTAADFYRRWLVDGVPLPDAASADYRLGRMHTATAGLKYGQELDGGREFTVRLEYYAQMGDGHPAEAFGSLRDFDLFPTVDAWMVTVGYTFGK